MGLVDRKAKKRGDRKGATGDDSRKLSKEEEAIAKFVRFNCPTNMTMFEGNEVHYFSGRKAVDMLVNSKKYGAGAKKPMFRNDAEASYFLGSLLERGLFFRAKKIVLKKKTDDKEKLEAKSAGKKKRVGTDLDDASGTPKSQNSPKSPKNLHKEKKTKNDEQQSLLEVQSVEQEQQEEAENIEEEKNTDEGGKEDGSKEEKKKNKKKVKLLFNDLQFFLAETSDVYVWVFDPTPLFKQIIGALIVFGTVAGCLFPLWPDWLRLGVYYTSLTGIGLFGLLIGVALFRTAIFAVIWAVTLDKYHKRN